MPQRGGASLVPPVPGYVEPGRAGARGGSINSINATTEATIALITGANKGIGLAAARRLARSGWTVLIGSRDPERGASAAAELAEDGLSVEVVELDVTSDDSVAAAVRHVDRAYGRLDVLVNNAGIVGSRVGPLETGADEMRQCYETATARCPGNGGSKLVHHPLGHRQRGSPPIEPAHRRGAL